VNGLGGGKISSAEINSIGVEIVWDCDGEVGRAYLLTPWCRVLLEKLTGLQLVKFPTFHRTRRFITALNKRSPPGDPS